MTLPPRRSGTWIRISALPGVRFSCAATSWSNLAIRALDLVWRRLGRPAGSTPARRVIAFCAAGFLALFLREALGLLLEIGRVIAFVREVLAAIDLEDPAHHIVEEVAVVGDHQHRAGIFLEVDFPATGRSRRRGGWSARRAAGSTGFWISRRVSAIRRFSPPDRLSTDQSPGGQRSASIATSSWLSSVQPSTASILLLELAHLLHQGVEVGVVLGIAHLAEIALKRSTMSATSRAPSLTFSSTVLLGSSCGSCAQIADGDVLARPGFALEVLVDAGHDLHQGRLAGAVRARRCRSWLRDRTED